MFDAEAGIYNGEVMLVQGIPRSRGTIKTRMKYVLYESFTHLKAWDTFARVKKKGFILFLNSILEILSVTLLIRGRNKIIWKWGSVLPA